MNAKKHLATNSLNLLPLLTRLDDNLQNINNRVSKYLKDPNAKQIHDVRTAIRRLDATFSTLPKKNRNDTSLSDYVSQCKKLFKFNSEIRDLDIIYAKLQKYHPSFQREGIIETLKATRIVKLEHAKTIARSLKNNETTKIVDKIGATEKELQKRYKKLILELVSQIESGFSIVITNPAEVEELHKLRTFCKKLRYLLELLPDANQDTLQTIKILKRLQDLIGDIHDLDFTIEYLKPLKTSSIEIEEIIVTENENRKIKFEEFTNYCKRRLGISPNSFLIRIRSLKTRQ